MASSVWTKITSIICLTAICCFALHNGIDSAVTGSIAAIIGGIAGYEFGKKKE